MNRRLLLIAIAFSLAGLLAVAAGGGAMAADAVQVQNQSVQEADIIIDQPDYVEGSPTTESTPNGTIHNVEGATQRIILQDPDPSSVSHAGIEEGTGSLNYDDDLEVWVYDSGGQAGTTTLYWVAEETRTEGNQTVTEEVRYVATIQTENVAWVHRTEEEDEDVQAAAENWEEMKREAEGVNPDQPAEETILDGLELLEFWDNPFEGVAGQIWGVGLMLTLTWGGRIVLGFGILLFVGSTIGLYQYRHRSKKQFAEIEDIDQARYENALKEFKKVLQQVDLNERLDDATAQSLRDIFDSPDTWVIFKQYLHIRSPLQLKTTVLQAMGQLGYTARVKKADGEVVSAEIIPPGPNDPGSSNRPGLPGGDGDPIADGGARAGEVYQIDDLQYNDEDDRAISEAIPGEQLDISVFDRPRDLDPSNISTPIDNTDVDDENLIDLLDPQFPGHFEDEQHFAESLAKVIELVADHEYFTDDSGFVREEMDLVNLLAEMDTILADESDFPVAHALRKQLIYVAEELDASDKLDEKIDEIQRGGVAGTRRLESDEDDSSGDENPGEDPDDRPSNGGDER